MQSPFPNQTPDNSVPPHIPGPAEIHAYVRALGAIYDYEGLYSFTTWLTKHHVEVTERVTAQHGGMKLFRMTLIALRAAVEGEKSASGADLAGDAAGELAILIKVQIESVEEWGGWPSQEYVDFYREKRLRSAPPRVAGR
jgi:hypothetical protein